MLSSLRCEKARMKSQAFKSVWDAIADTPEEAANLKARATAEPSLLNRRDVAGRGCVVSLLAASPSLVCFANRPLAPCALMHHIRARVEKQGLTQAKAAALYGVTQPRMSDSLRGKIDLFSLDMLVSMIARSGQTVELKVKTSRKLAPV